MKSKEVAPYAGAWIEIIGAFYCDSFQHVAPYAGAWIEIDTSCNIAYGANCRTLRGCVD